MFILDKKEIIISKDVDFNETENRNDMETIKPIEFNGFEIDDLFDIDNLCESENTKNSTQNQDPVQDSNANAPSNAIYKNTDHDSDNDELLYVPNIRRSARATAGEPPERIHENHIALMMQSTGPVQSKSIPKNFKSAVTGKDMRHWIEAMNQEFDTLTKMNTWKLVKLPKDRKAIRVKWVYDIKTNSDGEIERYRARLVAMGFFQREGVDFFEVFAPVVKYVTVRIFFCVTARHKWNRRTIDVRCAFINAFLNEEIYIMQPEGFVDTGYEDYVYLLIKAIYGLKQAAKAWHDVVNEFLISIRFKRSYADKFLYIFSEQGTVNILIVYVDDIKYAGNDENEVQSIIEKFSERFEIRVDEEDSKFLGMTVFETEDFVKLHHHNYIQQLLLD